MLALRPPPGGQDGALFVRDVQRVAGEVPAPARGELSRVLSPVAALTHDLQDVQEIANFFERRVSAYPVGVVGEVTLDAAF